MNQSDIEQEDDRMDEDMSPAERLAGQPMPLSDMTDLNGNRVPADQLRGKPLLIDFFATWCGPCQMASPALQKLHETYASRGLMVIGASSSEGDGGARSPEVHDTVEKYVQKHKLTYLVTYGNDAWSEACGVDGFPTFFFVSRNGTVCEVFIGYGEGLEEYFEQIVRNMLE